jgi:hypothetical protein
MTTLGAGIVQPILDYSIEIPGDRDRRTKGDALLIGADYSPGKATVRKASEPRNWDKRKGYGFSGATVVYTGDDLSEFDVDFYLWTERQQIEWDAFKKKYFERPPRPSTLAEGQIFLPQPKALGMQHPVLAKANITAAVVKDVMFAGEDDYGGFLWTVSFIQFRAPFFGLGRPDGTIPAAKKAQPTAKDKTEQEIDRVLEEIRQANDNLSRSTK